MMKTDWKGYTLDELRTRRLITQVKIDYEQQRLVDRFQADVYPVEASADKFSQYLGLAISWSEYLLQGWQTLKKIIAIFRNLKN